MKTNRVLNRRSVIWRTNRRTLSIAMIVFTLLIAFVVLAQQCEWMFWPPLFADYIDSIIAVGTFLVAALVWGSEKLEAWQESIPKKLNILYLLEKGDNWEIHVSVFDAPLVGESDIRNWGQSIGQTIFPAELKPEKINVREWQRINFIGFWIGKSNLDRKRPTMDYDLLVFLRDPILGAQDGYSYVFDEYGTKWKSHAKTPEAHQATLTRLKNLPPLNPPTP